jgi:uncharacterized spore protein YtfJ
MEIKDLLAQARDTMTVKRVFGDPIERDGVTVIPVAKVTGGAGGGSGTSGEGETSSGAGGGFGVAAAPAGVYVIKGQEVSWQPALDVNRVILGGQLVAIVLLLTVRAIVKARAGGRG